MALLGLQEPFGNQIERVVPGDFPELAAALRTGALQRMQQPVLVMLALGVARDLGADHAGGVAVVLGAMHAADRALVDQFDVERASRRTIVRTG